MVRDTPEQFCLTDEAGSDEYEASDDCRTISESFRGAEAPRIAVIRPESIAPEAVGAQVAERV
jgi:hypothetical protein